MEWVTDAFTDLTRSQPPPPNSALALVTIAVIVVVAWRTSWRLARGVITIVHEGAHAAAAVAVGRRLEGIRLHSDTSGLTVSRGKARGPGMILTLFAGYTGPALAGLVSAVALHSGYSLLVLWLSLLVLALILVQIRNFYGLWSVLAAGGAVFAVTWWAPERYQSLVAYAIALFLLIGALRPVAELQQLRSRGKARSSDADALARLTHLPGLAWVGIFGIVNLACAAFGIWLITNPLVG